MIICNKCGTPNEDHQVHCINCHYRFPARHQTIRTSQVIQSNVRQIPNSGISYPDNDSVIAKTYPEKNEDLEDLIERNFQEQKRQQNDLIVEAPTLSASPRPSTRPNATVVQDYQSPKANNKLLWISASVAGLLIIGSALFFSMSSEKPIIPNSSLFAEAENLYQSGNYSVALSTFQEFIDKHPDNALVELASFKIGEISKMQAVIGTDYSQDDSDEVVNELAEKQHQQIPGLMKKAKTAYLRKRYLMPEGENAIFFVSQIQNLEPEHSGALEIQNNIISFYRQKADAAFEDKAYQTAYKYYQNILKILPEDNHAKNQVDRIPRKHRKL